MRPIFCGNFEYDARESDLERLFRRYGKVDRIDMKSGFAFVYMDDERDAEDAIRALDQIDFGRKGRRLRVEWTKQERGGGGGGGGGSRRPEISRKPSSNQKPSKTLFVINFDTYSTRTRDLERHFDPYGKIVNVRIRKNFAFIQYESEEDAIKALDATNMSKLLGRVITVEFAMKDDDERRNEHGPDRTHERSPRRGYGRARSPSPYRRERGSPDYGQGRGRSSSPGRRERGSPDYARGSSRSPGRKERDSDYGRRRSPSPRNRRDSEISPRNRRGSDVSPRNRRASDLSPVNRRGRDPSPRNRRDSDLYNKNNSSPRGERTNGDADHIPKPGKSISPDNARSPSGSPQREEGEKIPSPGDFADRSPAYSNGESPRDERYASQSPAAREMS